MWNQHPQISIISKFHSKNAEIWHQKCFICIFSGWNFKTILSYLKSVTINFSNCKILRKKNGSTYDKKFLIWLFWGGEYWKTVVIFRNQHCQICQIPKICEKTTIPKLGNKNALLGIFDWECLMYVFLG